MVCRASCIRTGSRAKHEYILRTADKSMPGSVCDSSQPEGNDSFKHRVLENTTDILFTTDSYCCSCEPYSDLSVSESSSFKLNGRNESSHGESLISLIVLQIVQRKHVEVAQNLSPELQTQQLAVKDFSVVCAVHDAVCELLARWVSSFCNASERLFLPMTLKILSLSKLRELLRGFCIATESL